MANKVAVVTGGSGVLGAVFCKALAKAGYKVAILGQGTDKAQAIIAEITQNGGIAKAYAADVTNKQALEQVAEVIKHELGSCDLLLNGAGGNHPKGTSGEEYYSADADGKDGTTTFFDLDGSGIDFVMKLNYMGTLLPCQVFGRQMLDKPAATIINISSMSAFSPLTKIPAYSAAKAAINNFTQWLAVHFAQTNIRVNAIAPGFFLTQQNYNLLKTADGGWSKRAEKIIAHTPMGRFGEAEELIGTLLWLADEKASGFVNGVVIPVDGGFNAYSGV